MYCKADEIYLKADEMYHKADKMYWKAGEMYHKADEMYCKAGVYDEIHVYWHGLFNMNIKLLYKMQLFLFFSVTKTTGTEGCPPAIGIGVPFVRPPTSHCLY